jgi:hypothetical protein
MGIKQPDTLIRSMLVLTLEEMRKNSWILDDVFSDFTEDSYLAQYGQAEINKAREWFLNNKIEVLHKYRLDSMSYPCITVALNESNEDDSQATLADLSTEVKELTPEQINKPIPYMVKPFIPVSYTNGVLKAPMALEDVSPGMLIVDPDTGNAWVIEELVGSDSLKIKDAPAISADKLGVIPQYRVYRARRERASFRESYQIGCHVHGDPTQVLWLWSIVLYSILRYRESLLESRGFKISSVKSTDMVRDDAFDQGGENIYKRFIMLSGLVENTWLKSPKRVIEIAKLKDADGISSGVKIISDTDVPVEVIDPEKDDVWVTTQGQKSSKRTITMKG